MIRRLIDYLKSWRKIKDLEQRVNCLRKSENSLLARNNDLLKANRYFKKEAEEWKDRFHHTCNTLDGVRTLYGPNGHALPKIDGMLLEENRLFREWKHQWQLEKMEDQDETRWTCTCGWKGLTRELTHIRHDHIPRTEFVATCPKCIRACTVSPIIKEGNILHPSLFEDLDKMSVVKRRKELNANINQTK